MPSPTDVEDPKKPVRLAPFAGLDEPDEETPAAASETPAAKPAAAPSAGKPKHSSTVLRAARQLGVSQAKIDALDPDALDALVDSLLESRQAEYEAAEQGRQQQAAPAAQAAEEDDEDDFGLGEEYDEDFRKKLAKGVTAKAQKIAAKATKALEDKLAAIEAKAAKREAMEAASEIDRDFAALNSPLLGGKSKYTELDPTSDEMFRRNQLLKSLAEQPIKGKSRAEQIAIRARQLFGIAASETPAAPRKKAEPQVTEEQWAEAGVARPAGTRVPETQTGIAAAKAAIRQKIAERGETIRGLGVSHEDPDEHDDL